MTVLPSTEVISLTGFGEPGTFMLEPTTIIETRILEMLGTISFPNALLSDLAQVTTEYVDPLTDWQRAHLPDSF